MTEKPVFEKADVEERFLGVGLFILRGIFDLHEDQTRKITVRLLF